MTARFLKRLGRNFLFWLTTSRQCSWCKKRLRRAWLPRQTSHSICAVCQVIVIKQAGLNHDCVNTPEHDGRAIEAKRREIKSKIEKRVRSGAFPYYNHRAE